MGKVSESRLDASVFRILLLKFRQGLFENPYVNPAVAAKTVGAPAFLDAARAAQSNSLVLLDTKKGLLPLAHRKLYLFGMQEAEPKRFGYSVVSDPRDADVALIRLRAPFQTLHANFAFGSRQHEGDLDFKEDSPGYQQLVKAHDSGVATIVIVYLDRPAILTRIRDKASALIVEFGASDGAVMDLLSGRVKSRGRLPIELPSSMESVKLQKSDVPHDSAAPLYVIGAGR